MTLFKGKEKQMTDYTYPDTLGSDIFYGEDEDEFEIDEEEDEDEDEFEIDEEEEEDEENDE